MALCTKSFQDRKVLEGVSEGREGCSGAPTNGQKAGGGDCHPMLLCKCGVMIPMEKESRLTPLGETVP